MIGFTPAQMDDMSVWQFISAVEGYRKAHDPEAAKELSPAEEADIWSWLQTKH